MITIFDILVLMAIGTISFVLIFLVHVLNRYSYWKKRGVPGPKPEFFFGNLRDSFLLKSNEPRVVYELSKEYKNDKFYGIYSLWKPVIVIKDLDLAKEVMEKKFDCFPDHPSIICSKGTDTIFKSLFTMTGEVWRSRRTAYTKLFTPMRLKEYAEVTLRPALQQLENKLNEHVEKYEDLELFEVTEDYSLHAITSTFYGVNLIGDQQRMSLLRKVTRFFLHTSAWNQLKMLSYHVYPKFFDFVRVTVLPKWHWYFGEQFTNELFEAKEKLSTATSTNVLTLSAKLMNEGAPNIGKIAFGEAVAHMYGFLQAGTHTTQVTLAQMLHRLSEHQDVQDKLRKEISSVVKDPNAITYEETEKLTYLGNIITETLRFAPPVPVQKRICDCDCTLDDGKLKLEKGMNVYIDTGYIHFNEQHFPDPLTFNPDRYSTPGEADRSAIMVFGKGLRACTGWRFAMLEMKLAAVRIISNFNILPSKKMKPLRFTSQALFFYNIPIDGVWISLKKLEK